MYFLYFRTILLVGGLLLLSFPSKAYPISMLYRYSVGSLPYTALSCAWMEPSTTMYYLTVLRWEPTCMYITYT